MMILFSLLSSVANRELNILVLLFLPPEAFQCKLLCKYWFRVVREKNHDAENLIKHNRNGYWLFEKKISFDYFMRIYAFFIFKELTNFLKRLNYDISTAWRFHHEFSMKLCNCNSCWMFVRGVWCFNFQFNWITLDRPIVCRMNVTRDEWRQEIAFY